MASPASAAGSSGADSAPSLLSWFSFMPADALPFQTEATLAKALAALSAAVDTPIDSAAFAAEVDRMDPLRLMRAEFCIPKARDIATAIISGHGAAAAEASSSQEQIPAEISADQESVYLCGNSLGLLPRKTEHYVRDEMAKWAALGVEGHFAGARPWARVDEAPTALSVTVVGAADESEVSVCNSLSCNLHLLMTSFYRPTKSRFKILMEQEAFCSDHHVARSQVELHGLLVDKAIVTIAPRQAESTMRTEDIVAAIEKEGAELALVLLPGIQFYTGQMFDLEAITRAAHSVGAYAGFDLAHAVGNVPLQLHAWQVDFAAWCSYKYLNSGPGAIGGLFVHQNHHSLTKEPDEVDSASASVVAAGGKSVLPKLKGWWGQTLSNRFSMSAVHVEKPGAQGYMLSNPAVLPTVCMQASLELFKLADLHRLRAKSIMLTGYLEHLLRTKLAATASEAEQAKQAASAGVSIRVLTPCVPSARGCQLSLLFSIPVRKVHRALCVRGIVTDVREPNVLRVSPTPLYNSFADVFVFVNELSKVLANITANKTQ